MSGKILKIPLTYIRKHNVKGHIACNADKINGIKNNLINIDTMKCDNKTEIILKNHTGFFTEKCHNIIYCKANDKTSEVFIKKNIKPTLIAKCLKHVGGCLHDECFARVHHDCIVNLNHVKGFNKKQNTIKMSNGVELDVSVRKKPGFLRMYKRKFMII